MTTFERRQRLLDLVRNEPGLRVPEIARLMGVSEGTVRNDLNALAGAGQLVRVRGGATTTADSILNASSRFAARARVDEQAKQCIGRSAAQLVLDGDSILLDASTTVYHMARFLAERQNLRIVTNGIETARLLANNPTNTVILIGGVMNAEGSSVAGLLSEQIIAGLHFARAFVSGSGYSLERGLTEIHLSEAEIKRKAIESADQVIALVTASKIGQEDLTAFAPPGRIHRLFTDSSLEAGWVTRLEKSGIRVVICNC